MKKVETLVEEGMSHMFGPARSQSAAAAWRKCAVTVTQDARDRNLLGGESCARKISGYFLQF